MVPLTHPPSRFQKTSDSLSVATTQGPMVVGGGFFR